MAKAISGTWKSPFFLSNYPGFSNQQMQKALGPADT